MVDVSYSAGGQCWPTPEAAAQGACSALAGVTSSGVVSCDGVQSVGEGGAVLLYRYASSSGVSVVPTQIVMAPCEYPTFEGYWGPLLAALLLAIITVKSAMAIRGMFKRETL